MYIPYADVTIVCMASVGHRSITIWAHCAWTALYNASPDSPAILTPPINPVVDHIVSIVPAMSTVPWVDNDCFFVLDNIALMPDNSDAAAEESFINVC